MFLLYFLRNILKIIVPNALRCFKRIVQQITSSVVVVSLAFLRVNQHIVSCLHGAKPVCSVFCIVAVRVVISGFLAIRLLHVGKRGAAGKA